MNALDADGNSPLDMVKARIDDGDEGRVGLAKMIWGQRFREIRALLERWSVGI